ncbi:hypothetical protein UA08_09440 [Talaromyces atroroseus]|uniref:Uncharacterized protein n=1 Tax=Talaromyces atroroseus TaxID=1441469 RepID=A0A225A4T5_TALAT|nr:hypothetical protein UA08_09440 [Talaromyces atroroseus]OKL55291.1 hypothetical protein UA08_09440 [Talaromyces atroroseus]
MTQSNKEIPIEYIGQTTDDNTTSGFVAKRVVERTEIETLQVEIQLWKRRFMDLSKAALNTSETNTNLMQYIRYLQGRLVKTGVAFSDYGAKTSQSSLTAPSLTQAVEQVEETFWERIWRMLLSLVFKTGTSATLARANGNILSTLNTSVSVDPVLNRDCVTGPALGEPTATNVNPLNDTQAQQDSQSMTSLENGIRVHSSSSIFGDDDHSEHRILSKANHRRIDSRTICPYARL